MTLRPLKCCASADGHPRHKSPCKECGWEQSLYDCPTERTADHAWYKRWEEKVTGMQNGKQKTTKILQRIDCTRKNLLDRIKKMYKNMAYHRWVHYTTRHMELLDIATVDKKDIVVKTDFAAAAVLKASHTETCEIPTTAHECVAMVLHSPQPLTQFGVPRQVTCDIWRVWSDAKGNEEFHQMVMRDITAYYKRMIPGLRRIIIKSDGCRGQYKGKCNFKNIGTFHLQSVGQDLQQAAATADSRTALAVIEQEQKKRRVELASISNATAFLSKAEVAKRSVEFNVPHLPKIPIHLLDDHRHAMKSSQGAAEAPLRVLQIHDFPASHHYSGPHDNAGKAPRTRMRRAEAFETDRITDYHECYEFCIKNMPRYV